MLDPSQMNAVISCVPGGSPDRSSGQEAFIFAARYGDVHVATWLCEKGVDANSKVGKGFTALHVAAMSRQAEFVKWLVEEKKLDANAKSETGVTAVHTAALGGNIKLLEWLVNEKRVDYNARDDEGRKAWEYGVNNWKFEAAKWLGKKGDNSNEVQEAIMRISAHRDFCAHLCALL
jgi:ankyrin repeat protein